MQYHTFQSLGHDTFKRILISFLVTLFLVPTLAGAQDASDEDLILEVVMVTASKREVNLQDLAISVKAFTLEDLSAIGADTFTDFARLTPSLSFAERGAQRNRIIIRGMGPSVGNATTGIYLDGVPAQVNFESVDPRLFDIERIEILRGPQGTLYGEGSLGGTILYYSSRPNLQNLEGKFEFEYGDISHGEDLTKYSAMINIPIVDDTFGIRVVGMKREQNGWIDFPLVGDGIENGNTDEATDIRVIAAWQATEKLKITGIYYYQDARIEFDQAISPTFASFVGDNEYVSSQPFQTEWDWTTKQGTLEFDYDLGFANLVGNFGAIDRERSLVDSLFGPAFIDQLEDIKSAEVRLVSTTDGPFSWITGVYYRDRQSDIAADLPGAAAAFGLPAYLIDFNNGYKAKAIYGELSYDFTDTWRITGGARYFDEDVTTFSGTDFGIPGFESEATAKNSFSNVSPKLALEFRPNDNTLVFGGVSVGFRSGGNNVDVTADPDFQETFDEDRVIAYELGLKQTWADGRIIFNPAIFYNDWKDIQINGIPGNSALGFTTNGGQAHSKGIEADFTWIPAEGWTLTAGGALIDAETDEPMQGGPEGSKLENVPDKTFNASASYTWAMTSTWNSTAYIDYSYRGESFGSIPNTETNHAAPYSLSNARFDMTNGSWRVTLYVSNIFDELGSSFSFNDGIGITDQVFIIRPRTYGFRVQYAFTR